MHGRRQACQKCSEPLHCNQQTQARSQSEYSGLRPCEGPSLPEVGAVWVMALLAEHPLRKVEHKEDVIVLVEAPDIFTEVAPRPCTRQDQAYICFSMIIIDIVIKHSHIVVHTATTNRDTQTMYGL